MRRKGFTLAEALIVLAIIGVISALLIPKLMTSTGTQTTRAVVSEVFANTGELFMRRQADSNFNPVVWNNNSEAAIFTGYIQTHLNAPACTDGSCIAKFPSGAEIISVSDATVRPLGAGADVNAVVVEMKVPKVSDNFKLVIVPPASDPTGTATRYSTMYGITGVEDTKVAEVEEILKTE